MKNRMTTEEFLNSSDFHDMLSKHDLKVEDFTCHECKYKTACPLAFDLYNVDGDCLAK